MYALDIRYILYNFICILRLVSKLKSDNDCFFVNRIQLKKKMVNQQFIASVEHQTQTAL